MKIARWLVSGTLLAAVAGFVGCAEDNDKAMMKSANQAPPAGAAAPQGEFVPPPLGNDPAARAKFEEERQKKMMQGYPGYKGQ